MENEKEARNFRKLYKMGLMTSLAVGIHNFPEGIATFMSALKDPTLGIAITVAIAIHNITNVISTFVKHSKSLVPWIDKPWENTLREKLHDLCTCGT